MVFAGGKEKWGSTEGVACIHIFMVIMAAKRSTAWKVGPRLCSAGFIKSAKRGWAATDGAVNEHRVARVSGTLARKNSNPCHTLRHTTRRRDNGHTSGHRGGQSNNRWRVCGKGPEPKEVAALEAIPILSQPPTYINISVLFVWVVTSCNFITFFLLNKSNIYKMSNLENKHNCNFFIFVLNGAKGIIHKNYVWDYLFHHMKVITFRDAYTFVLYFDIDTSKNNLIRASKPFSDIYQIRPDFYCNIYIFCTILGIMEMQLQMPRRPIKISTTLGAKHSLSLKCEGFPNCPDPKKKTPTVVKKKCFIWAHHTVAASHVDWQSQDKNRKLTNSAKDSVPLIRREAQCRKSLQHFVAVPHLNWAQPRATTKLLEVSASVEQHIHGGSA